MNQLILRSIRPLLTPVRRTMSRDAWKERDDAAEKVYISSEEKKTLERLVNKMEENRDDATAKDAEFQRRLDELLKKHGVGNEAFAAEVNNLHRNL